MTIRQRITLVLALMFVAIMSIGGFAVYQSRKSAIEVKSVTEGVVPSALASADLMSQLKDVQVAAMTLASTSDESLIAQAREKLAREKGLLKSSLEFQARNAQTDAQRGLVNETREGIDNYFSAIDDTVKLKAAGKNEIAQANLFGNVVPYQEELEQIVDTLRIEKNRAKDAAIVALNANLSTTTRTISIVTIFAIVVLTTIGMLLYRQITGPLARMQAMMSDIAASQDFTRRVPVVRMDEIGRSIVAFNGMIERIQESSVQLRQKTADIHAMLQNMPQGVLTIEEGVKVHPEYSAYLETIFETQDIAGRDAMELVFAETNLGADALAQVDAVCRACIGEDVMNFDFNRHLMIAEAEKTMPDGRVKVLDLSWAPITDDDGITTRLMLCVRDVTELRKLAAEAGEQKRKLEIIGEILAVSQEKFHDFVASATHFVDENERIIRLHTEPDTIAVTALFRNMHTIKGNARTYGLQHLTNIVHEVEQTYDALRKPDSKLVWEQRLLLDEVARVREAIEAYARLNEVSLGRKGPGRRGSAERYLMVDKDHIRESLHSLENVNTESLDELVSVRNAVRRTLRLLGTEPIAETLAGVLESVPSLARELGKEAPVVWISDNGYRVRSQVGGTLKNVFMHLVRNTLDHGLEAPEERHARGKAIAGTIHIQLAVLNGMLQISMSDDGRGLALARIRNMAIEKGMIDEHVPLDDEEIAHLIFRPGFSTAASVTEISGRGVGMDAVQDFVKREHGRIELQFTDNFIGADFRHFKTVIHLPETVAVDSGEGNPGEPVLVLGTQVADEAQGGLQVA